METVKINLYSFDELSPESKEEAMWWAKAAGITKTEVKANGYLFYADGIITRTTTFTGEHARAGQTDFHFHGETIPIIAEKKRLWECNSCGFSDYSDALNEKELSDWVQCSNCGGNEFHLITKK